MPRRRERGPFPLDVYPETPEEHAAVAAFIAELEAEEAAGRGRQRRRPPGPPAWARAKRAFEVTFADLAPPKARVEIGWVSQVGHGLSRRAFSAGVTLRPDPGGLSGDWIALVPVDPEQPPDLAAEVRLLDWLKTQPLTDVRVPTVLATHDGVLLRSFLHGFPVDVKRNAGWMTVAEVAVAVHRLAPPPWLPGHPTRRAHAIAALSLLEGHEDPVCVDALAWGMANLPDERPASLLHGDLLGQNILAAEDAPPALIDWEYAQAGDPAYDLAIVTRGARQPFKLPDGLTALVEAYTEAGGVGVTVAHVRLFELALAANWYVESLGGRTQEGPEAMLGRLRGILRRCQ